MLEPIKFLKRLFSKRVDVDLKPSGQPTNLEGGLVYVDEEGGRRWGEILPPLVPGDGVYILGGQSIETKRPIAPHGEEQNEDN